MYVTLHPSPVGRLTLASDGAHLVGVWIEGQKYHGAGLPAGAITRAELPVFDAAKRWLDRYFAGERPAASELPLHPNGSDFRREVWRLLCEIPYGEVTTYGDLARKLAEKPGSRGTSARAVGGAVGHNPISIVIPCHRVVGAAGGMTGYAGGIEIKQKLLQWEGANPSQSRTHPKRRTP